MDLFRLDFSKQEASAPLARRMAPETLEEFVGQTHLLGEKGPLRRLILEDRLVSAIFFGPPGTGKTALAQIIAKRTNSPFLELNAQEARPVELRKILRYGEDFLRSSGKRPVLFVDEIHRFNRLQQEILLPAVERGTVVFLGSTVQNPFFALSKALLSRTHLFEFKSLSVEEILTLLRRALKDEERGLGKSHLRIPERVLLIIAKTSDGDARRAYNLLELVSLTTTEGREITEEDLLQLEKRAFKFDRTGDEHYDMISALIKSLRGSDPDASLYWLVRLLEAGEDPRFIIRRLLILAAEDIGLADPNALRLAASAQVAFEMVGRPEGDLILTEAVLYLATAPKSNTVIKALQKAKKLVQSEEAFGVPNHLKDSHYAGAKKLGRGKGYVYPHGKEEIKGTYLPPNLEGTRFFEPADVGYEKTLLMKWKRQVEKARGPKRESSSPKEEK